MDKNDVKELYAQATQLAAAEQYAEALDILERLVNAYPKHPTLCFARAKLLVATGKGTEALAICEELAQTQYSAEVAELSEWILADQLSQEVPPKHRRRTPVWAALVGCIAGLLIAGGVFILIRGTSIMAPGPRPEASLRPETEQRAAPETSPVERAKNILGEEIDMSAVFPMQQEALPPESDISDDEFLEFPWDGSTGEAHITLKAIVEKYGQPDRRERQESSLGSQYGKIREVIRNHFGPLVVITESDEDTLAGLSIRGDLLKELYTLQETQMAAQEHEGKETNDAGTLRVTEIPEIPTLQSPTAGLRSGTVTAARKWKCPQCGNVLMKGNLGKIWNAGDPIESVGGKAICGNCKSQFQQADVYGGVYDVVEEVQSPSVDGLAETLISVLAFQPDSLAPPENPRDFCAGLLKQKYQEAVLGEAYYAQIPTGEAFSVEEAINYYRRGVEQKKWPDLGEQYVVFTEKDALGRDTVVLCFAPPGEALSTTPDTLTPLDEEQE